MLKRWILLILFLSSLGILNNFESWFFPKKYSEIVTKYSQEFQLEPELIWAIIKAESSFHKDAVSQKRAIGLMQLMFDTANSGAKALNIQDFNEKMLFNEETNIRLGSWYIRKLYNQYDSVYAVLAAYNAGGRNVKEWFENQDYKSFSKEEFIKNVKYNETRVFIARVMNNYIKYKQIYGNKMEVTS